MEVQPLPRVPELLRGSLTVERSVVTREGAGSNPPPGARLFPCRGTRQRAPEAQTGRGNGLKSREIQVRVQISGPVYWGSKRSQRVEIEWRGLGRKQEEGRNADKEAKADRRVFDAG